MEPTDPQPKVFIPVTIGPGCTIPPPVPPQGSSDWAALVHPNCFDNLERLGLWIGETQPVASGQSPSRFFLPSIGAPRVAAGAPGEGLSIYVVVHGWAPGYRAAVNAQGGRLRWWDEKASSGGVWASEWAWSPVSGYSPALPVNPTGLLQSIKAFDPVSMVFAYSWIDDSATDGSYGELEEVYQSEAYTQVNGIRLANALRTLLPDDFWTNPSNTLHLIGHSHGAKVATVAALTLQNLGLPLAHLTLLDAPESEGTLNVNGANFLGFFLGQMAIADPANPGSGGTFVDNYPSYFGVAYGSKWGIENVVDVALKPSKLYYTTDPGDKHSYAAAWYGASAAQAQKYSLPRLGLSWPPPGQKPFQPALLQTWASGVTQREQWRLLYGSPPSTFLFSAPALPVDSVATVGNVSGSPAAGLVFGAPTAGTYSSFLGGYENRVTSYGYGLAFDLAWTGATDGDYLVFTAESGGRRVQEVVLVLDGRTGFDGTYPLTLAADVSSFPGSSLWFYIFYFPAHGNTSGQVTVSNFRRVKITS